MRDARRGGVDQGAHAVHAAGRDDIPGATHIGIEVVVEAAPGASLGGDVEHRVDFVEGAADILETGQIALDLAHTQRIQPGMTAA